MATPAVGKVKRLGVALAPRRDQHRIDGQRRAGDESVSVTSPWAAISHSCTFSFQWKMMPAALHRRLERLRNFGVEERQQLVAPVDDVDLRAERGEGAGVLAADHARADHRHRLRNAVELQDRVGVVDLALAEGKKRRAARARNRWR